MRQLSYVVLLSFMPRVIAAQTVSAPPFGWKFEYEQPGGRSFTDSIASSSANAFVIVRQSFSNNVPTGVVRLDYRIDTRGTWLVLPEGDQPVFPNPWPPAHSWTYHIRNTKFTYNPIGADQITIAGKLYDTEHLLVTVEDSAGANAFELWVTSQSQVVKRSSKPRPRAGDFALISANAPTPQYSATPSLPSVAQPIEQRPSVSNSATSPSTTGEAFWGLGAIQVTTTGNNQTLAPDSAKFFGAMAEVGLRGEHWGLRVRYGVDLHQQTAGNTRLQFGSIDLTVGQQLGNNFFMFAAGGLMLASPRTEGEQTRTMPEGSLGLSIRLATSSDLVFEGTGIAGSLPRTTSVAAQNNGTSTLISAMLRFH